jgi:hypothetical protein
MFCFFNGKPIKSVPFGSASLFSSNSARTDPLGPLNCASGALLRINGTPIGDYGVSSRIVACGGNVASDLTLHTRTIHAIPV